MADHGRNDNQFGNIELQNVLGTDPNIDDKKRIAPITVDKSALSNQGSSRRPNEVIQEVNESPDQRSEGKKKNKYILA